MHIPSNLQSFPSPALIIAADGAQAKIFFAKDRTVEIVKELSSAPTPEGEKRDREKFFSLLSETLMLLIKEKHVEHIAVTVPDYYEDELKESLHMNVLKRIFVFVPKLLVNEDPMEIVAIVQELAEE